MIYFISEIMHRGSPIGHQSSLGEEARLRARIARDTRRLAVIGSRTGQLPERYIASAILDKKRFAGRSYAAFLLDTAHATRGFELWDDIVTYFRRFRLISTAMRLLSVIISAIEAGAAFIIAAGVVLALSPRRRALPVSIRDRCRYKHRIGSRLRAAVGTGGRCYLCVSAARPPRSRQWRHTDKARRRAFPRRHGADSITVYALPARSGRTRCLQFDAAGGGRCVFVAAAVLF